VVASQPWGQSSSFQSVATPWAGGIVMDPRLKFLIPIPVDFTEHLSIAHTVRPSTTRRTSPRPESRSINPLEQSDKNRLPYPKVSPTIKTTQFASYLLLPPVQTPLPKVHSAGHLQLNPSRTISHRQPWSQSAVMAPMKNSSNNLGSSSSYGEASVAQANVLVSCYVVDTTSTLKGFHYCTTGVPGAEWYS
jgi:hypothetical protein